MEGSIDKLALMVSYGSGCSDAPTATSYGFVLREKYWLEKAVPRCAPITIIIPQMLTPAGGGP